MVFTVRLSGKKSSQSDIKLNFDIGINDHRDSFIVLEDFQSMWSDICYARDHNFKSSSPKITGISKRDKDAFAGTLTSLNSETIFTQMLNMAMMWVPEDVGRRWIRYLFGIGDFCIDQVCMRLYQDNIRPALSRKQIGCFTVQLHKFENRTIDPVSHLGEVNDYSINSYKDLCKKVYETESGMYPHILINPVFQMALIPPRPNTELMNMQLVGMALSAHVICDAFTHSGKVTERTAKSLWRLCKLIRDGKVTEDQLIGIYINSMSIISERTLK